MKFRIVKLIHDVHSNDRKIEYIIQKKTLFAWKEIFKTEIKPNRISHKTFEDAESYLFQNYMGHGLCTKVNNEYTFEEYQYFI